jgi:hypothetical protein
MNSLINANAFQLWSLGLSIAVALVCVSLAAFLIYIVKNRPMKEDPLLQHKMEERLSELAQTAGTQSARSH